MIVASKDRYLPVMVNMIVLSQSNWYFYVHRDVFEQAVVLMHKYRNLQELTDAFGEIRTNAEAVAWFYEEAPKPLHMLAPYLSLVEGELAHDIELCCGTLHVISSMISILNFIGKPAEIRRSVSFSPFVREEYAYAWECFLSSCVPYKQHSPAAGPAHAALSTSAIATAIAASEASSASAAELDRHAVKHALATEQQTTLLFAGSAEAAAARGCVPTLASAGKQASEAEKSALRQLLTGSGGSV